MQFIVALLIASSSLGVHARNKDFADNLARELLGHHYEHFRGLVYSFPVAASSQSLASDSEDEKNDEKKDQTNDEKAEKPMKPKLPVLPAIDVPCFQITIPWPINRTILDLIEPCGNITIPAKGMNFTTPFGSYHIEGADAIDHEAKEIDNAFSAHTAQFFAGMVALYALLTIAIPSWRAGFITFVKNTFEGDLNAAEDPNVTAEDKAREAAESLDIDSAKFCCPGNIYRLVTVMHPGEVGYKTWLGYCFKAGICAYMQFYLPVNILKHVFSQWAFNNIKSPIYFAFNMASFATQFAALGNVCALFASKCANVIEEDAAACHFLMSHEEDPVDAADAAWRDSVTASVAGAVPATPGAGLSKVDPLLDPKKTLASAGGANSTDLDKLIGKKFAPPAWLLSWNELFWSALNMVLTCFSSIVLMLAMFLKIATFTGDIMNITLVAVSLYFVFELDDKVMDSDKKLRPAYRRLVITQTKHMGVDHEPRWIKMMASITISIIRACMPVGLAMIVLVSWRQVGDIPQGQKPMVIGGDPFHQ